MKSVTDQAGVVYKNSGEPPRRGGQAEVYRATAADGRAVAIKVYHGQPEQAEQERRILDEVRTVDPRAGEWLVTVLGHGRWAGRPFLVLPWMPESLEEWLPRHDLCDRLALLEQAAAAVARLHRSPADMAGYRVHRDIKPANFLVAEEKGAWVVRLADLGIAKQGGVLDWTENTAVLTRYYAPPEQMLPLRGPPSESWDVHALAVLVFYGITGRFPSASLSAQNLLNEEGMTLLTLVIQADHGGPLKPGDQARLDALQQRPPQAFLDLGGAVGWKPEDGSLLEKTLADGAPEATGEAVGRAAARLGAALARGTDPDPRTREVSARPLVAALREARGALFPAETGKITTGGTLHARVTPRRPSWGWALAGLALLGVLVAGGIGGMWWWAAQPPEAPVAAAPLPIAPAEAKVAESPETVSVAPPTPSETPAPSVVSAPPNPKPPAESRPRAPVADAPAERATPVEPIAPEVPVNVTFWACPVSGVTLQIDGDAPVLISKAGLARAVAKGMHTLTWTREGAAPRTESRTVGHDGEKICANLTSGTCYDCL